MLFGLRISGSNFQGTGPFQVVLCRTYDLGFWLDGSSGIRRSQQILTPMNHQKRTLFLQNTLKITILHY